MSKMEKSETEVVDKKPEVIEDENVFMITGYGKEGLNLFGINVSKNKTLK